MSQSATTRSDRLDLSVAEVDPGVPRNLTPARWWAWRRLNRPGWLLRENRRGTHCGVCGNPLGTVTRLCFACHQAELEAAARDEW